MTFQDPIQFPWLSMTHTNHEVEDILENQSGASFSILCIKLFACKYVSICDNYSSKFIQSNK